MSTLQTALHDWHAAHHGRMVDFAGWDMPVQYTSIVAEHQAVRKAAGLFDIAHMGRLKFTGPDAAKFLDHLLTCDVAGLSVGQIRYSLVCNDAGGILDDVLVYRFDDHHLLVVNASNRQKILDWIGSHQAGFQATVEDLTLSHFMLAVQGPRAESLLQPLVDQPLSSLAYYFATPARVQGQPAIVSRTGYTGEEGFEVILEPASVLTLWENLLVRGGADVLPCGLGCRDTLRLEAAMPLYGHELNEQTDPYTAGLAFGVKLDKPAFIGQAALVRSKANAQRPKRVGLELTGRRIARGGAAILANGTVIGHVTSGTFSPTLERSIAMGYVAPEHAAVGTPVEIDIRGQREAAKVVKLPYYKRS
jgi:aminomethyltransferase